MKDTTKYHTELRELMDLIRCRMDKNRLKELTEKDERFDEMDEETYETASVLLNAPAYGRETCYTPFFAPDGRNPYLCKLEALRGL